MFGGDHETDLLLAKLSTEDSFTKQWVFVENSYTLKGVHKGRVLTELLASDPRFQPFRDKVTIVELDENLVPATTAANRMRWVAGRVLRGGRDLRRARRHFREVPFFHAERLQRDAVLPEIARIAEDGDWVIATDVDELVDLGNKRRAAEFQRCVDTDASMVCLQRVRFQFDFDNLTVGGPVVPALRWNTIRRSLSLDSLRRAANTRLLPLHAPVSAVPLVTEYTYCFPPAQIARKLSTYAHVVDDGESVLAQALRLNHALKRPRADAYVADDWFETYPSDGDLHPAYVRDHFAELRTGVVNPDYRAERARFAPGLFAPPNS